MHRSKHGLLVEPDDKTLKDHKDIDKSIRDQVKTTTQLLEARFKINTKDINQKTAEGQKKTSVSIAKRNANERYREPELHSIYDLPTD